jgi:hypothetical protein
MQSSTSIRNISIGIPDDRWKLICEAHPETARYQNETRETIEDPDIVYEGNGNRFIAVKQIDRYIYLIVIYNEKIRQLVTVFITRNLMQFDDLKIVWKKNT